MRSRTATATQQKDVPEMVLDSARLFAERAQTILPDSAVYLFGSQAKGCATQHSDIDVAVLCQDLGPILARTTPSVAATARAA